MFIGRQGYLVVSDPVEVERLISGRNVDVAPAMNELFAPLVPRSQVSLPTNNTWKHHRRVLGPSMHRRYLSRMTNHISNAALSLVKLWDAKLEIAGENSFGTNTDFGLATADSIASISMGFSFGCVEAAIRSISASPSGTQDVINISIGDPPPLYRAVQTTLSYITLTSKLPFPSITMPIYMWLSSRWRNDRHLLRTFMLDKIAEARRKVDSLAQPGGLVTDADCILDMLIQHEIRERSDVLTTDELVDELLTVFIAGQETTASVLAWFVKYMPKDPDIQRRLHGEICSAFGSESSMPLSILSDAERLPILEAVTVETLRCAQVASITTRHLLNDDIIMGRPVSKGSTIMIPMGYLGLKESEWGPDAKEWRPTRWLSEDGLFDRNRGADGTPFGLGHRSCFGEKLARTQLKIFIATLSRAFFFKPVEFEFDSWDSVTVITRLPKKCHVRLEHWG